MRAVVLSEYGSLDNLRLMSIPALEPGERDVIVDVRATAINYVDLVMIKGQYQFRPTVPFVPGKGPAGIVRTVGSKVTNFVPGDRVLAMAEQGGYAEQTLISEQNCYHLPDKLSFVSAASMALVFDTAWLSLLERGRMVKGETVLIMGASGGVGLAAIQLVKAFGCVALAAITNAGKADLVKDVGADHVILLGNGNIRETLRDKVFGLTDGRGADVVLDPLGGKFFEAALRAVAWSGRLVVIGFAAGDIPTLKTNYLLVKNIDVGGLQISDYRRRRPDLMTKCFSQIFSLCEEGMIRPLPSEKIPLSEFKKGLRRLENRSIRGRIVINQEH